MYEVIKGVCVSLLPVVVNGMYHICSFFFLHLRALQWVTCVVLSVMSIWYSYHCVNTGITCQLSAFTWKWSSSFSLKQDWIYFLTCTTNIVIYFDVDSCQLLTVVRSPPVNGVKLVKQWLLCVSPWSVHPFLLVVLKRSIAFCDW